MTDKTHFEDSFLKEVERGETIVTGMVYATIKTHPDAYPFVLKVLNEVLQAGIDADTIGGSEPDTLRSVANAVKAVLNLEDAASKKFITAV